MYFIINKIPANNSAAESAIKIPDTKSCTGLSPVYFERAPLTAPETMSNKP